MARPSKPYLWRGKQWRVQIDGKLHYLGSDERKARAAFYRLMARRVEPPPADQPQTVEQVAALWLRSNRRTCYVYWLRPFVKFAGPLSLSEIRPDLLTRYAAGIGDQYAPESIRHFVHVARAVLRWAHELDYVECVPRCPKLPRPVRKSRDVEPRRLAAILDELPNRARSVLRFIAATGCRPGEACKLEWRHVRLDAGLCVLDKHKTADATGRVRTIYLGPLAGTILREQFKRTGPSGPVFVSRLARPYTPAGLRSILRTRGIVPYALRHTFAQNASETVPVDVLAVLLGHAGTRSTGHYYQVRDQRALAAAATLRLPQVG